MKTIAELFKGKDRAEVAPFTWVMAEMKCTGCGQAMVAPMAPAVPLEGNACPACKQPKLGVSGLFNHEQQVVPVETMRGGT